jgi:hypothetical protein
MMFKLERRLLLTVFQKPELKESKCPGSQLIPQSGKVCGVPNAKFAGRLPSA